MIIIEHIFVDGDPFEEVNTVWYVQDWKFQFGTSETQSLSVIKPSDEPVLIRRGKFIMQPPYNLII